MNQLEIIDAEKFTQKQLAQKLERDLCTVKGWVYRGIRGIKLKQHKIVGRAYILKDDLEEFLAATSGDDDA